MKRLLLFLLCALLVGCMAMHDPCHDAGHGWIVSDTDVCCVDHAVPAATAASVPVKPAIVQTGAQAPPVQTREPDLLKR